MANRGINYISKNFADIRSDLIDMVRQYYPDIFNDFNDASAGLMLLELKMQSIVELINFHGLLVTCQLMVVRLQLQIGDLLIIHQIHLKTPKLGL